MSWLPSFLTGGIDLDAEQKRSAELDAAHKAQNDLLVGRGLITQDQADEAAARIDTASAEGGLLDTNGAVTDEFVAGAQEGLQNVLAAPGKAVGAVTGGLGTALGGILKNIPFWLYALGAVALFIWLGGLTLVKGRLAKGQA